MEHNYLFCGGEFYRQRTSVAMGAKFAPSLAHLFMALWEEQVLYPNKNDNLHFWCSFIDDAFYIWKGDVNSLKQFMADLNSNTWVAALPSNITIRLLFS